MTARDRTDRIDDDRLGEAFRALEGIASGSEVDTERVWKAVTGELGPDERREVIDRVALDPGYAEAWRIATEILRSSGSPVGGDQTSRKEGPPARSARPWRSPYVLALAALLLMGFLGLIIVPSLRAPSDPVLRGGAIAPLLAPEERLPREDFRLRWEAPAGARFDVRVTSEDLSPIDAATDLTAPEHVVPAERLSEFPSGTRILWQVDARLADGTLIRSETFIAELE